jgi:hypothetical protein
MLELGLGILDFDRHLASQIVGLACRLGRRHLSRRVCIEPLALRLEVPSVIELICRGRKILRRIRHNAFQLLETNSQESIHSPGLFPFLQDRWRPAISLLRQTATFDWSIAGLSAALE